MSGESQIACGSRCLRLWELSYRFHCPVVGVCFNLGEIRELIGKLMTFPGRPTDCEVHCIVVNECGTRTPMSSLLHKTLETKYSLPMQIVRHFKGLVQLRGGEFMHHDGGKEESLKRLEAVIAAADTVICQTGCISHDAYWRV